MKNMKKKRYNEEYEEGSNLLWPSEEEDEITRKFYRDLSHLSKNIEGKRINKKFNFIKKFILVVLGRKFN
jgi:hypothetical protein